MNKLPKQLRQLWTRASLWLKIAVISTASVFPAILSNQPASAAQLASRSLAQSTTKYSAAASNTFNFNIGTAGNIGSMQFDYCTTPLGTCTAPTGLSASAATLTSSQFAGSAAGFTIGPKTANQIRITRTAASVALNATASVVFAAVTNPNSVTPNNTFYVRITTFSDAAYTTAVDTGVVAGTATAQLTVNARVQERLDFCVGSTAIDDATTIVATDCSTLTAGTTIDLGVIDNSQVNISPVSSTDGGNTLNGMAMIRTNALNGAVVSYISEQNSSSGKLKVAGATCSGVTVTDQCFNSAGTTKTAFTAGTEMFGMTAAYINTGSRGSGYTGSNLVRDTAYAGDGTITGGFAWDDTGTADIIASSAASTIKVLDDEALILKFAATSGVTTPTGQYTVTSTYIATATF